RHPREAIEAWLRRANRPPAHYLVANTQRTDAAALAAAWAARGIAVRPARPGWPVLAVAGSLRDVDGELNAGLCYPQDLWSFAISRLVPERPYRAVADLCAAPGGKSFALSLRFPDTRLTAMDSHPARLAVLARRAAALGLDRIATVVGDAAAPPLPSAGYDLVLVDAPCSGTGTLQHNPDLRWKLKPEDILRLSRLQRPILAAAAGLVAPGGILIYATCSAEPEENEAVVSDFLEREVGAFRPLSPDAAGTQFITPDGYFRTFPAATEGEGFFAAVMERQATAE
ncbi:MAG TPA: RsmB/NOP family class I SAM-dependent RNA methyltransferase, partial [Acidobacteriota bacterium]|nr:RsmB/NOP family class I SAM-dependent RNA methyltransferase [Acidobacteriota bacterium]